MGRGGALPRGKNLGVPAALSSPLQSRCQWTLARALGGAMALMGS